LLFELGLRRDTVVETFVLLVFLATALKALALGIASTTVLAIGYPDFASAVASFDKDML
jgi:hypothetical protein